ncbi:MAG: FG-GAP-like repeat-containing protein, partial [Pyrinomonadaceae bacterium]
LGANAAVVINFGAVGGTSGTITGSASITPTQLAQIRQHLGYVNVHTTSNGGGEIRGQLGIKRPVDFDGDGRQDYSILRFPQVAPPGVAPITYWNLNSTVGAQVVTTPFDANTDFPAPGDYDGDGKDDYSIYRSSSIIGSQSSFWILKSSNSTVQYYAWGLSGDAPVARDYDGDGVTDIGVFRNGPTAGTQATWYIRNSSNGSVRVEGFGLTGNGTTSSDSAIPGDYDGDGKFDIAVYRFGQAPANTFIVKRSSDGVITYQAFGNFNTDYVVPGDYDGDGKYDYAVARTGASGTSPMVWWIINSGGSPLRVQQWGISSDLPVQGDYDGDARTDIAIYRRGVAATSTNSSFWVYRSFDSTGQQTLWGLQPDFPVATFDAR